MMAIRVAMELAAASIIPICRVKLSVQPGAVIVAIASRLTVLMMAATVWDAPWTIRTIPKIGPCAPTAPDIRIAAMPLRDTEGLLASREESRKVAHQAPFFVSWSAVSASGIAEMRI
ncbi:hypothetical protein CQ054_21010 [Ochrobactrum sp. MYb29]|nr:hypothetical protein CQ054_21010 [Ochrobactrum sp. MYb29]